MVRAGAAGDRCHRPARFNYTMLVIRLYNTRSGALYWIKNMIIYTSLRSASKTRGTDRLQL